MAAPPKERGSVTHTLGVYTKNEVILSHDAQNGDNFCDVCHQDVRGGPTISVDSSDGEYGSVGMCEPCVTRLFQEYRDAHGLAPPPPPPPSGARAPPHPHDDGPAGPGAPPSTAHIPHMPHMPHMPQTSDMSDIPQIKAAIQRHQLKACKSAPDELFEAAIEYIERNDSFIASEIARARAGVLKCNIRTTIPRALAESVRWMGKLPEVTARVQAATGVPFVLSSEIWGLELCL